MDYIGIEEHYLTYYKFLDGVSVPASSIMGTGCDLSFNDGVTAAYLLARRDFRQIYLPYTHGKYVEGFKPLDISRGLQNGLSAVPTDFIISIGGTFNFMPIDEVACGVYNSLKVGGNFLFGIFPQLFDDNGTDILDKFSADTKLGVSKKLNRWSTALSISFGRYFPDIEQSVLIADTTADEVRDFYRANSIYDFLCRTDDEFNMFFNKLNDSSRLYMFWQILKGCKK